MENSSQPESTLSNIFTIWGERVIRIETNHGFEINISDLEPLKHAISQFIEQNLQTDDDTSLIEDELFHIYGNFMLSIHNKCSGETIYGWILADLIIKNIFNRHDHFTFEQIIEMRTESLLEDYLKQYNPVSNFGDLF
jgi:hypothetical protein